MIHYWENYKNKNQKSLEDFEELKNYVHSVNTAKCKGDKKKMAKLNEVAPVKPLFEGIEKVNKDDLINKRLIIEAFAEMDGDDNEKFGVIKVIVDGKMRTTSINQSMLDRLKEGVAVVGIDTKLSKGKELVLAQPIEVVIEKKTSSRNGKDYFCFSND